MSAERTFLLHGLAIRSTLPLAPAPVVDRIPHVVTTYEEIPGPSGPPGAVVSARWQDSPQGGALAYVDDNGHSLTFAYDARGSHVDIRCSCRGAEPDVADVFQGPGMAALMALRGAVVLHAAAVVTGGSAILILGESGAGKSTLAAAMTMAGAAFLTEEVSALVIDSGAVVVTPGSPRIALHPSSRGALTLASTGAEQSRGAKRWFDPAQSRGGVHRAAAPIAAVYVLSRRCAAVECALTPLSPHEAAAVLLRHQYGRSWLPAAPADCLHTIALLTAAAEVFELGVPDDLERVHETADWLLRVASPQPVR